MRIFLSVICVIFCLLVLSQEKTSGLGSVFGGSGGGGIRTQKRGAEKLIDRLSIFFATLYLFVSVIYIFNS